MDCRSFHKRLEDYLEGGMDFPARFGMERHAKQCYACEKHVADALRLRQRARELARVAAPVDFESALLAKIQVEKARHRFWKLDSLLLYGFERISRRAAVATAAAAVLIAGTAITLWLGPGYFRTDPAQVTGGAQLEPGYPGEGEALQAGAARLAPARWGDSAVMGGSVTLGASGLFSRDNWAIPYAEPGDSEYFEFLVPVSGERQLIMRLPKTIRMRYDQPSREFFIRNVSH